MKAGVSMPQPQTPEELQATIQDQARQIKRLTRQLANLEILQQRASAAEAAASSVDSLLAAEQQKLEKYMKLVLHNSPDIIMLLDGGGHFAYCTTTFLKMAGLADFSEISGRDYYSVLFRTMKFESDARMKNANRLVRQAMVDKQPITLDETLRIGGGEPRHYRIHFTPMVSESGEVEGSLAMFHDDTEVTEARRQAEAASRAKSDFLSTMSHEMRTPMNAIIGLTNIARAAGDIEKKDYCLDKIDDASIHLLGVINDILDMSKIEAGKFELSFTDFAFEKMLVHVTNVIAYRVGEKQQDFKVSIARDVPAAIVSDEQRLAQVITNLLSNAVKFTPEKGEIALSVELLAQQEDECTLLVKVRDTGIGVTDEQKKRLFRSFQQADSGIARKYGGTGLGLAISKSIVEMLGGEIWVESEAGSGSTFAFTFKAQRGQKQVHKASISWENLRILVVDDAPEVLEYFDEVAQSLGFACRLAAGGHAACQLLAESNEPFNVFFVDLRMPGMDGLELTRRIKADYGDGSIVIMISAAEWEEIEEEATQAGVDRFIPKPLFASVIADTIIECVGTPEEAAAESDDGIFAGNRILLAEDIDINREIVLALLENTGLTIDCAKNGVESVDMFEQNYDDYDMIFMDIHMPEMDGYAATRAIRQLKVPRARTVPIIAMTANVFREDVERCLAAGMNGHVGKPLDMEDVMAYLKKYLL